MSQKCLLTSYREGYTEAKPLSPKQSPAICRMRSRLVNNYQQRIKIFPAWFSLDGM